jgi:hypothetical protein
MKVLLTIFTVSSAGPSFFKSAIEDLSAIMPGAPGLACYLNSGQLIF